MDRNRYLVALLALLLAGPAGPAVGQSDFPNRRVHVLVPYPAGGIVDIATRIVTDKLAELWRQPFVVEAKPGANGNVAWDQAARAEPDGYTWTFVGPAIMANPRMRTCAGARRVLRRSAPPPGRRRCWSCIQVCP
jgi:tripartite-type tricarboxylate transporter receptor subunit TctC